MPGCWNCGAKTYTIYLPLSGGGEATVGPKPFLLTISVMLAGVIAAACAAGGAITAPREEQPRETPGSKGELLIVAIKEGGVPARMVPNVIEVKKGTTVVFRFSGLDDQAHTFTATTLDVDLEVAAGATKESKPVTFNQNTTVFFFCRFHKGIGAAGSIKIIN
jgi:plastocyanin